MKNFYKFAFSALLISGLTVQACSNGPGDDDDTDTDSDNDQDDDFTPPGGAPGTGGTDGNGTGGLGGDTGTGGVIIPPPPPRPTCPTEPDGTQDSEAIDGDACWTLNNCNVTSEEQLLQRCNTNCYPFANGSRIEGWNPGEPLPGL